MAGSELGDAMTKKPSTEGGLEVAAVKSEYRLTLPDGSTLQMIGARASQLALLFQNQKRSPTLEEFGQVFILEAKAERQKPSHVDGKQSILRHHLLPVLGATPLDSIGHPEVMRLKASLAGRSSKTVNNVLSVLRKLLKTARAHGLIEAVPEIRAVKSMSSEPDFFSFEEFAHVVQISRSLSPEIHAIVMLGGHAGLRRGEILGMQWADIDFDARVLRVMRSVWRGSVQAPKSNRTRAVPMTTALVAALEALPRRSHWVLTREDGSPVPVTTLYEWGAKLAKRTGMPKAKRFHVLRHTFCSHLAMKGAPTISIKELAGHTRLDTTQRYMHSQEDAKARAIQLLEGSAANKKASGGEPGGHNIGRESRERNPDRASIQVTLPGFEPEIKGNSISTAGPSLAGFSYVNPGTPDPNGGRDGAAGSRKSTSQEATQKRHRRKGRSSRNR